MKKLGSALIEVLVAMGIAAALMPAIVTAFFAASGNTAQDQVRIMALGRLREAQEVMRLLKESSWSTIATNGTFHPVLQNNTWSLSPGAETSLDSLFTRTITISDAYRDINNTLSLSGTLDPSVKHVHISVTWDSPRVGIIDSDYYLMRFENLAWLQTLVTDFDSGTHQGTTTTNVSGGELTLGSGGTALADWCAPSLSLTTIDLPKSGVANAISAQVGTGTNPNKIVSGTGDNASGVSLAYATITNANPPSGSVQGTFDGYKTNGVFVDGGYGYIGTDNNSKEVVIVDLNNTNPVTGKYLESGYFNVPGNGNASAVYVTGNLGFALAGSKLYSFDLSSKSGARTQLSVIDLSGTGAKMVSYGNYLFIAESSGSRALEVVEFSPTGNSLNIRAWFSVSGKTGAAITVNSSGSRGYLATNQGDVYIINTSTPYTGALPIALGTYSTSGMTPKGIRVVTNNKAIVVGTGGTLQYQVIDITNENSPSLCTNNGATSGGLVVGSGINDIDSVQEEDGDTFSYILTGDASAELKVIQGGPGGGGGVYANTGIFESSIFDAGTSVMFNRFDVTGNTPVDTTLRYQLAITDPVGGSCVGANYSFVGPDKLASSYFTASSSIPLGDTGGYSNPSQCLKYRVYLDTTNSNNAPTVYDLTFNYSP